MLTRTIISSIPFVLFLLMCGSHATADETEQYNLSVDIDGELISLPVEPYGGIQDQGGFVGTFNDGTYFSLLGNLWKKVDLGIGGITIGPNTVIEFDFISAEEGEIHGIGFDNNDLISSNTTFKLYGTQNWGINDYDNYYLDEYNWAFKHYTIPVGQYFTGQYRYLTFVCDKDHGTSPAECVYQNITIRN